jgi:hypothetical protein
VPAEAGNVLRNVDVDVAVVEFGLPDGYRGDLRDEPARTRAPKACQSAGTRTGRVRRPRRLRVDEAVYLTTARRLRGADTERSRMHATLFAVSTAEDHRRSPTGGRRPRSRASARADGVVNDVDVSGLSAERQ